MMKLELVPVRPHEIDGPVFEAFVTVRKDSGKS